jgi:formate dehydrogenase major subunit
MSRQQSNPTRELFPREDNLQNPSGDEPGTELYPYVFTTYRLTEHHTAGGMSRWQSVLSELQPEFFCEVSPELARERGLENNGWATLISARTAIEARVMVTERMAPLRIAGRTVHQIGLPYHWGVGSDALITGDSANDLFGVTLDANVHIQETKVASCDIQPGRRPRGPALLDYVAAHRDRAHVTTATGNQQRTPPEGADGKHASEAGDGSGGSMGHSVSGQVSEGHAPGGQDTNAGPEGGS